MRPQLRHFPAIDHRDPVGHAHCGEPMRDHDANAAFEVFFISANMAASASGSSELVGSSKISGAPMDVATGPGQPVVPIGVVEVPEVYA